MKIAYLCDRHECEFCDNPECDHADGFDPERSMNRAEDGM